jgi:TonB family protein
MRWTLVGVLALASVAAAQQPPSRPSPPPGVDISARDGDRIIVDDDARIQIVRRRQATIRAIFSQDDRLLIVLVDYSKPGEFPDGQVDWAFNFYQVDGTWPLGPRWEGLTAMYQYEGEPPLTRGLAFETQQGLVQLAPNGRDVPKPDSSLLAVLLFRGSSSSARRGLSFAEAETVQLTDAARSKSSGATVSTLMTPAGAGATGTGTSSASLSRGTAAVAGAIRGPSNAPRKVRDAAPIYPEGARRAKVSGIVILELALDVNGIVTDARVVRSVPLLDAAAIEAVKQWQYEPMVVNGKQIPISLTVSVPFVP